MASKRPLIYSSILAAALSLPVASVHGGKILEARAKYQEVMREYEVEKEKAWGKVVSLPHGSAKRVQSSADWHTCLYRDFMLYETDSLRERMNLLKGSKVINIGSKRYNIPYDLPGPVSEAEYKKLTDRARKTIDCWATMQ